MSALPVTAVEAIPMFVALVVVNAPPGMIVMVIPGWNPCGTVNPVTAFVPVSVGKIVPVAVITPAGGVTVDPRTGDPGAFT